MKTTTTVAALLLGGLLCGGSALAQTLPVERLERLEAGTAALAATLGGDIQLAQANAIPPSLAADFEVRLQRMERVLSELTGRVEESTHQITQLRDRLERLNGDVDFRLSQIEKGGDGAARTAAAAPSAPATRNDPPPSTAPGTPPPAAAAAALPAGANPDRQYEHAFGLLQQSDYVKAEKAFQDFLAKNKGHTLAGNAQYWLGETYYVRGKYADAAVAFAEGVQKYPKNNKAPDNLLKLGMALGQLNQKNDACTAYKQLLQRFPEASASIKRRADTEKRKLNCPA
ncbi:tol-pal system protein YbgF [Azospirillum sp. RWY-5-1]|uniref:Cell division coordinator CpoB n=1 Tax=Azospirillum oleiclasticum TaxID=2735135 RepID=A0ABX2TIL0_9PROT|nr:tol-pal system protein YbgF [Azospirillum oleiclasticum]NYZ15146.1 tol-pal system protein YbgF [Azospirillum oleiclasticum]NYZ22909.1 tol-pal system protein YbgF [Azospirillum oleiclasticum]